MKRVISFLLVILIICGVYQFDVGAVSAKAAVVINGDTGEILYSHNADTRLPMASTTKIMTALLLCELGGDLSRTIVTTPEMVTVEGSSMGLLAGDTVSLRDLLYGMMLPSGNDAANTTAIVIGGSVDAFVGLMNNKAAQMGLHDTHFCTPSGLDAEGHYTTAYELALIAREALKNETFAEAAASKTATLNYGNPPYRRTLTNHNKLLRMYDDVVGVKTGFTKKSGRCLVSAARKDGKYVIAVTLNDGNDWADHRTLLDSGLASIEVTECTVKGDAIDIDIANGGILKAQISPKQFSVKLNSQITYEIIIPQFLYAPLNAGEQVGEVRYYIGDNLISTEPILCDKKINPKNTTFGFCLIEMFKYLLCLGV